MPEPENKDDIGDLDKINCSFCLDVVVDPKYCKHCFYPTCDVCIKRLRKNKTPECNHCTKEFEEADPA